MRKTNTLKHVSPASRAHLGIFILVFAAIGGVIIWRSLAAPNPNLPGDLNSDNTVGITDLSILLSDYGSSNTAADINSDGTVNVLDLSVLLSNYGKSYSSPPAGTLLFDGAWPASGSPSLSIWSGPGTSANGATVVGMADPLGSGKNVGYFKVARNNTNPCCTYAGRADFESPELMSPTQNNDVYISVPVYIPISNVAEMYKQTHNGFMVMEPYGPPYGGSPAAGSINATATSSTAFHYDFTWNDYGTYDSASCEFANDGSSETQWTSPAITTNVWHTIILHMHWSSTTSGFTELWYDGVPQQFHASSRSGCPGAPPQTGTGGPNTRIYYPNFVSANNGGAPNFVDVNLYGNESTDGAIFTAYHGETKIGTTLSIVQPGTPAGP